MVAHNDDSSQVSGIVPNDYEGIESQFTQVSEISGHGHCRLVKAMRYGRWHVLKGLKAEVATHVDHTQRLRKELEIMMALSHQGIVQVYGLEQECDNPQVGMDTFIVMEWVDGTTLNQWLATHPNAKARHRVAQEIIDAVNYIHHKGIAHRDLKPENIMITRNGSNAKIIDFGLADNDTYAVFKNPAGTKQFIAPEQLNATEADSRNDIYSLGMILGLMKLDKAINQASKRCLKPINDRYQTIDEMIEDIERHKHHYHYARIAAFTIALSLLCSAILMGLGYMGRQKLENPSGNYQIVDDGNGFVYTNWDSGKTNAVSVQYIGTNAKNIYLNHIYTVDKRTWQVGELGFGCFRNHNEVENVMIDCTAFGIQKNAFKGCTHLKSISMPYLKGVPKVGNGGWQTVIDSIFEPYHFDKVTLYVPNVETMKTDKSWGRFKHIEPYEFGKK